MISITNKDDILRSNFDHENRKSQNFVSFLPRMYYERESFVIEREKIPEKVSMPCIFLMGNVLWT